MPDAEEYCSSGEGAGWRNPAITVLCDHMNRRTCFRSDRMRRGVQRLGARPSDGLRVSMIMTGAVWLRLHVHRLKSSLSWKYTAMMQSPPSSHLSSWTCPAGCDHTDPGPPVWGAAPSKVCVNLPWITTP